MSLVYWSYPMAAIEEFQSELQISKFLFYSSRLKLLGKLSDQPADHFENFKFNKFQSASLLPVSIPIWGRVSRSFDINDSGHYRPREFLGESPLEDAWRDRFVRSIGSAMGGCRQTAFTQWTIPRVTPRVSTRVTACDSSKWSIVTRPFTVFRWKGADFNAFEGFDCSNCLNSLFSFPSACKWITGLKHSSPNFQTPKSPLAIRTVSKLAKLFAKSSSNPPLNRFPPESASLWKCFFE